MSNYTTSYARAFLRATWMARSGSGTFLGLLQDALTGRVRATDKGVFVVATSQNGKNASFAIPPGLSSVDLAELCEELLTLHEKVAADLVALETIVAEPVTPDEISTAEESVYAEMLARLQPRTDERVVFSELLCA